ncbi:MAG: LTA synthase family protein [Rickettsia endosymbiont of Bryobia graminum]|nr:LTA synthase family protein [Rickettsia endosymbiont of Bryobia graminum]
MIKQIFSYPTVGIYLIFQLITRIALSSYAIWQQEINLSDLLAVFISGIFNDLVSLCYFLPVILIFTSLFYKLLARYSSLYKICTFISYFYTITIFTFISFAELTFWDEFSTRFNFIAVDYLIYTNEIIGTVKESLPYREILFFIILLSALLTFLSRKWIINRLSTANIKNDLILALILTILAVCSFNFYNSNKFTLNSNKYAIELGKNGLYEFCSAFINNSLDYNSFYPTIDKQKALDIVRSNLVQKIAKKFLDNSTITRKIDSNSISAKKYNIILITVESLSAEFMGKFGNEQNITPNLDRLADESIFFTNLYAVGTRTVRGLEAITLSVPPTPGSSIIRRPNNQSLFNIATIFRQQGYIANFIFGGYSYFDNLQNYFQGNNYNIVDRGNLKASEISFSNIWGVADEDIFNKALELADQNYQNNKEFFSLIMTTSNHRPYTFKEGRIDLPSGSGRAAAVKYTDYAINKFLELAKARPWFNNTIFIITADHCASSAGKTDLPINKYHIPLLIYAPNILKPQIIDNLASQIDIAPTILGLLNFSYDSKFFGQDILNTPANRAFISTYQLLGLIKNNNLVILSPNNKPVTYQVINGNILKIENNNSLVEEAISFYQTAYDLYVNGTMKE